MYSAGGQQGGGEDDSAENSEMDTEEGVAEVSAHHYIYQTSCGVNGSSLFKWLLIQNCMRINGMTFFSLKLFPLIASGPQKPQKLTASKIKYESFGPKILIPC